MPPNTPIFILGLAVGTCLLLIGLLVGFWFGRRAGGGDLVDRRQFLDFLRELSQWTSEFSGDVSKYQSQLTSISQEVEGNPSAPKEEISGLLAKIMQANQQLQARLDSAESKLETQTDQISNYLEEARTDGLTGLMNRRAFDKATDELFEQWQHKEQSFALGLVDIDHFKHINDTYGHPAGDAVLKEVARQLQQELGNAYCVARYGGEEFAMLSVAPVASAAEALDELRQTLEGIQVTHEDQVIQVTMSGGAAEIGPDDKIGNLVRHADEALYAAKLGGRNRVYLHDGTICRLVTQVAADTAEVPESAETENDRDQLQSRVQERLRRIVEEESRRVVER